MIDKALFLVYNIIVVMSEDITGYMQTYRSGHNGADSKSCRPYLRLTPQPIDFTGIPVYLRFWKIEYLRFF